MGMVDLITEKLLRLITIVIICEFFLFCNFELIL